MITHYATDTTHFQAFTPKWTSNLMLDPTGTTPFVSYDKETKFLIVKGNASDPNMQEFFDPIFSAVKRDAVDSNNLKVYFYFKAMNTSTVKVLFDLFKYLRVRVAEGTKVQVVWGADAYDLEMMETGRELSELYNLNFRYLAA